MFVALDCTFFVAFSLRLEFVHSTPSLANAELYSYTILVQLHDADVYTDDLCFVCVYTICHMC